MENVNIVKQQLQVYGNSESAMRFSLSILLISFLFTSCRATETGYLDAGIRNAAVSGKFYPGNDDLLSAGIDFLMGDAVEPIVNDPVGLIVPHAGYIYSGQIAADAYNQARNSEYDLIVILGTNHTTAGFNGVSIFTGSGYKTPLGIASIDQEIASKLINSNPSILFEPKVHRREHSVEVQVPFIQRLFPGVPILPVVIGYPDPSLCSMFAKQLDKATGGKSILVVASSDLSHYPDYDVACSADLDLLNKIVQGNISDVHSHVKTTESKHITGLSTCACGLGPIMTIMEFADLRGVSHRTLVSYANSGDATIGDDSRVVGYGAIAFSVSGSTSNTDYTSNLEAAPLTFPLNSEQQDQLLSIARKSVLWYLESTLLPLPRNIDPALNTPCGAFVTINKNHRLRGCIGHMAEDIPLARTVGKMALQAAFNDHRFQPVSAHEIEDLEFEISVLTPYQEIKDISDFEVGRDGIVIRKSGKSAVYLPQVAPEQGWDREETLYHLCKKAGLPGDAWKMDAKLFTFTANVFHE